MTKTLNVALAGAGAFGLKHLDAIQLIEGVQAISLVGRGLDKTKEAAGKYGVGHATTDLAETLRLPGLDAVILATPTQIHAAQALQCLEAGKHVQVEIPLADRLKDAEAVVAMQGPISPTLGIAMDMSVQLKAENGAICTLSLSFNNEGPLGTFFRYIGDTATYIARYDDLVTGKDEKIDVSTVDVSMNGIELQDREFFAAIREEREPNASVEQVLPCYRVLDGLERQLG